jgi:hypothetical protein
MKIAKPHAEKRGTTKPHIRMRKLSSTGKSAYGAIAPAPAFPSAPGAPAFDPNAAPPAMGGGAAPAPAGPAGPGGPPGM